MRPLGRKPLLTLALLGGVALLSLLWQSPAYGGGPLLVGQGPTGFGAEGQPFVWDTATPISYHTDQGMLGNQTNTQANDLVRAGFDVWQNTVSTASISFARSGQISVDVTGANWASIFNALEACDGSSPYTNIIVYDDDGSITDDILGAGQNNSVLGFAGAVCINTSASVSRFTAGEAVLNGLFIDGQPNPGDPLVSKYQEVFVHEFGHLIGLDHSQINVEVLDSLANRTPDNLFGLPLMFPVLLSNVPARTVQFGAADALAPDDKAWLSWLYPSASFNTTYGAITGTIYFSDGITQLQGANVIARQVDDLGTTEDESRRFAVSVFSGFLYTGNPGQNATGTNTGGDQFGSRDPALIGAYEIPVLPEDYTVEVESFRLSFEGSSSIGPIGEQFPLPGPAEFYDLNESSTDDPAAFDPVTVDTPGTSVDGIDIIVNGTPSRFDTYESAP